MKSADEIFASYPTLFPAGVACGFDCPPGWLGLVDELCAELEPLAKACEPDPDMGRPYVVQVKEKLGGLRYYISCGSDRMYLLIDKAEDASFHICQMCGKPGELRSRGRWLVTVCEEHNQ